MPSILLFIISTKLKNKSIPLDLADVEDYRRMNGNLEESFPLFLVNAATSNMELGWENHVFALQLKILS